MIFSWNIRCFLLHFIIIQIHIEYIKTSWPTINSSRIQLLGLFPDINQLSIHSRAMFKSAILLSHKYNITINGQFLGWKTIETGENIINTLSDTCQAISSLNITGIIGPGLSREAMLLANYGNTIGIPIISYSVTTSDLSDRNIYSTFYRTIPSDKLFSLSLVKLFLRFNWTSCIIIYQNDDYGLDGIKIINQIFINYGLIIKQFLIFNIKTFEIEGDFKNSLIKSTTRIIFVWAKSNYTNLILQKALDIDVIGSQFIWLLTSNISLTLFHQKLIGLLITQPITSSFVNLPINRTLLIEAYDIWKTYEPETLPQLIEINSYGLYSFDATWSLIQSLKQFSSNSSCLLSFTQSSSSCFHRQLIQSNSLLNILNSLEFLGISGPIQFNINVTDRINGSYFYLQNIQSSLNNLNFIPVLKYSDSNDWNIYSESTMIIWPGNSLIQPNDQSVLKGLTLRIGVIESPPFTIVTNNIDESGQNLTKLTGYMIDLIKLLENKIGFIANIQLVSLNQSYSQFIQGVIDDYYDIAVGDITVTASRKELFDFSNSIFDNSLTLIIRKNTEENIDLLAFLKPFSRNLWLLVLAAFLYSTLLFCLIERFDNEILQNRSLFSQITMSMWYSFGNIVGFGVDYQVRTAAGRILTVALYILSLVLIASYTANLASDLTLSKSQDIISNIDDLKSGKIPFNKIGIITSSASEQFYLNQISNGNRNYYLLKSRQELYDNLLSGIIDVSFMNIGPGQYITNNIYCNLTLIGDEFYKSIYGIVTPKEWIYLQELDKNILSLRESGELDNLKVKWFQSKLCPNEIQTTTAMKIQSMTGLFLIFAILTGLAFLVFIWKKRRILKHYLFILICRKNFFFKNNNSTMNRSNQIPNVSISSPTRV
ncbi:hypothetical protein I4U23_016852 [Adineta vaga]|nr:hypothetical protein I4U23_016852 [Adineta vaga]